MTGSHSYVQNQAIGHSNVPSTRQKTGGGCNQVRRLALAFVVATGLAAQTARAEDFSIYTRVYDLQNSSAPGKSASGEPVARTHSLFHAGKAYDHLDSMGEVIVFEPVHKHFILLNTKHRISTTVTFDEVQNRLALAEEETRHWLTQLEETGNAMEKRAIGPLRFQLDPTFDATFDQKKSELILDSSFIRYAARCSTAVSPATSAFYLEYADWMSRLNYVLHPTATLPGSRLALNQSLRSHQVLPTTVELKANIQAPIHMRAVHQFEWSLNETEQRQIAYWESMLASSQVSEVSFQEYQSRVLVTAVQTKRR